MDIGREISWAQKFCTAAISAKIQCDVVRGAGKMAGKSSQIGRSCLVLLMDGQLGKFPQKWCLVITKPFLRSIMVQKWPKHIPSVSSQNLFCCVLHAF